MPKFGRRRPKTARNGQKRPKTAGNGPKTCIDANGAYCAPVGNPVPDPKLGLLHCVLLLFRASRAAVFWIAKEGLWASNMMEDGGKGLQSVQDMEAEFRNPPEIRHHSHH